MTSNKDVAFSVKSDTWYKSQWFTGLYVFYTDHTFEVFDYYSRSNLLIPSARWLVDAGILCEVIPSGQTVSMGMEFQDAYFKYEEGLKSSPSASGCYHKWVHYKGFHKEEFDYCVYCDEKRNIK